MWHTSHRRTSLGSSSGFLSYIWLLLLLKFRLQGRYGQDRNLQFFKCVSGKMGGKDSSEQSWAIRLTAGHVLPRRTGGCMSVSACDCSPCCSTSREADLEEHIPALAWRLWGPSAPDPGLGLPRCKGLTPSPCLHESSARKRDLDF